MILCDNMYSGSKQKSSTVVVFVYHIPVPVPTALFSCSFTASMFVGMSRQFFLSSLVASCAMRWATCDVKRLLRSVQKAFSAVGKDLAAKILKILQQAASYQYIALEHMYRYSVQSHLKFLYLNWDSSSHKSLTLDSNNRPRVQHVDSFKLSNGLNFDMDLTSTPWVITSANLGKKNNLKINVLH